MWIMRLTKQQLSLSLFSIPYPRLMSTDMALFLGTVAGLYGAFWGNAKLALWGKK